jgi:tetratricopeptide (TPR) repeat protein
LRYRVLLLLLLAGAPAWAADDVPGLAAALSRRAATDEELRALLGRFGAEIPNDKGVFVQPPRPDPSKKGDPDWLEELKKIPDSEPGRNEAIQVVTNLRALATIHSVAAADAILDFAFAPAGLVFRDECGRQLRAMSPYSLPTLLRASQDKKREKGSYARYATYQLDRLGKNRPAYALATAPNDEWEAAILDAIGDVKHPDAVTAVIDRLNAPSSRVRKAARGALMAYVSGPPPPPAPKAKRKLPGGKLTDEEMPLYLTYREFAENELRRVLQAQTGAPAPAKANPEELAHLLIGIYDRRRAERWDETMLKAHELLGQKKVDDAIAIYDRILVEDPTYPKRGDMVAGYLERGRAFRDQKKTDEAILSFHKAWSLDPKGAQAKEAEAELYATRAAREQAQGRNADEDLRRAQAADPAVVPAASRSWMLVVGIAAGAAGLLLGALGLLRRRRSAVRG